MCVGRFRKLLCVCVDLWDTGNDRLFIRLWPWTFQASSFPPSASLPLINFFFLSSLPFFLLPSLLPPLPLLQPHPLHLSLCALTWDCRLFMLASRKGEIQWCYGHTQTIGQRTGATCLGTYNQSIPCFVCVWVLLGQNYRCRADSAVSCEKETHGWIAAPSLVFLNLACLLGPVIFFL